MSYLVTGATGAIGKILVERLAQNTRTLSRHRGNFSSGIESVEGDLTSPHPDPAWFEGVESIFLFPAQGDLTPFLRQAIRSGVRRLVVLSSLAASLEFERDRHSPSARHHLAVEQAAKNTGLSVSVLRPGSFANNLRQWAPSIQAHKAVFGPYPDSVQAPIHEADIADCAAVLLTQPRWDGGVYALTGPQALTRREQLAAIGAALGTELIFHETTPEQFRGSVSAFLPEPIIAMLLEYWSDTELVPETVKAGVTELTGRPGRTLASWALDHKADFTALR
jgi:uncharacterized protein YbjT (DUF2867 family)